MEKTQIAHIQSQYILPHTTLVVVSKTQTVEKILEVYTTANQKHFGENKVQELFSKYQQLPKDIHWHFIGNLQKNKIKQIVPFIYMIHSISDISLLMAVQKEAQKINKIVNCLIQVHIAEETTKSGFTVDELRIPFQKEIADTLSHVRIMGLMGMATHTADTEKIRKEFAQLKTQFDSLAKNISHPFINMQVLSMGMSNDYKIALQEGSTLLRIGSIIFGATPNKIM
ncbi:MAG: YggS family pyridoxal phosphate-dependent enzyme [Chitinophagaceae bacterium]|nr:YggS family pyridoxal phosphate-dependent enzyme [Chitinophagaceae bacterium]